MTEYFTLLCSFRKYPYPPPPTPATEGNGNSWYTIYCIRLQINKTCIHVYVYSEGRGSKRRLIPRGWGVAYRGFFQRVWVVSYSSITASLLSKLSVISLLPVFQNKSCSLHWSSFIYGPLKSVFHGLRESFLYYNCHRLMNTVWHEIFAGV